MSRRASWARWPLRRGGWSRRHIVVAGAAVTLCRLEVPAAPPWPLGAGLEISPPDEGAPCARCVAALETSGGKVYRDGRLRGPADQEEDVVENVAIEDRPKSVPASVAAERLGVSARTIQRWCEEGAVRGAWRERSSGRQGWRWMVPTAWLRRKMRAAAR